MLSASQLHRRGLVETNAGRHARARQLFLQALGRQPTDALRAHVLLSLAHAEFELRGADQALKLLSEALSIPRTPSQVRGLIYSQLGVVHSRAGNGSEALAAFSRGLQLLDDSPEPRATAFLNRGNVHLQRGDITQALSDFGAAQELAADETLHVIRAKAEHNFGYASMLAGDLTAALTHMDRARGTLEDLSTTYRAVCNQERAEVLVSAGMVTEAELAFRAAATAYGARGLRQRQGEAELVLARLLLRQDAQEAGRIARRAARRFRERGSEAWALRADLVVLCSCVALRRYRPSMPDPDDLHQGLARHRLTQEMKLADLQGVEMELQRGNLAAAGSRLRHIRMTESEPLANRLLNRETRARLAAMRGRQLTAMSHVRSGLAELHSWQSSFGSLDLQSSIVGHGRSLAVQGLSLAVQDGHPEVVFEWAERARALASRVSPVRPPRDASAASDLATLRRLRNEIEEAAGAADPDVLAQAEDLTQRIRQRSWYDAGSGVVTEPVQLGAVAAELARSDGVLVSYLVVHGQVHALAVSGGQSHVLHLGAFSSLQSYLDGMQADLDVAATRLSGALRSAVMGSLRHRVQLLSDALVAPLRHLLGERPAVLVPSGLLAGVPWSMLEGLMGRPLTVQRSASAWLTDRPDPSGPRRAGFVAGPRVDRSEEEVLLASKAWSNATTLTGDQAHVSAVCGLASGVDVFHVAAHGRHSAENPLFSGLELADGPLFGYDIDQLESIPQTVVLSACEVGRSSVRWAEETIGMTVAWLHAGAGCVIASPAMVNDDIACELLATTHEKLAAGLPPSHALAEASRVVDGEAPIPFMCFGSGW